MPSAGSKRHAAFVVRRPHQRRRAIGACHARLFKQSDTSIVRSPPSTARTSATRHAACFLLGTTTDAMSTTAKHASRAKPSRAKPSRWTARFDTRPTAPLRLFCFPYAGGSASIFRPWVRLLPDAIDVCPVEYPGHGTRLREDACTRLPDLVASLADALAPHLDRPHAFFGHSMGGLLGFELARALRHRGHPGPLRLFISAVGAPQYPHIPRRHGPVYALPPQAFLETLQRLNGVPNVVLRHEELMGVVVPILRADFELIETYVPDVDVPLGCPIDVFGGREDPVVDPAHLEGWREHTSGPFSLRMMAGDHFFLRSAARDEVLRHIAGAVAHDLALTVRTRLWREPAGVAVAEGVEP